MQSKKPEKKKRLSSKESKKIANKKIKTNPPSAEKNETKPFSELADQSKKGIYIIKKKSFVI